jgi:hypothetical protein
MQLQSTHAVSGHMFCVERKRGPQFYEYRLAPNPDSGAPRARLAHSGSTQARYTDRSVYPAGRSLTA